MRRLALLLGLTLLLAAPVSATEYSDHTVRLTLPDDFAIRTFTDGSAEGFEASHDGLYLYFFSIRFSQAVNWRNNLKIDDARWIPSLEEATRLDSYNPICARYEKVSTYRQGDKQIRVYRYVAGRSLCFLIAETTDGDWTVSDAIAKSQRYHKDFAFFRHNFTNGVIRVLLWASIIAGCGVLIFNLISKWHNRKFLLAVFAAMLLCGTGLWLFGWPPSFASLIFSIWPVALLSSYLGGHDDSGPREESDTDIEDETTFDGSGPTIDYNP